MDKLLDALGKIHEEYRVFQPLQELWPKGRLDLVYNFGFDHKGHPCEGIRIEAWPRNGTKAKALGKRGESRPDADTVRGAWEHVVEDLPKCKWERKPLYSITDLAYTRIHQIEKALLPIRSAIQKNAPKPSNITIRFRTPRVKYEWDDTRNRVRLSISPVKAGGAALRPDRTLAVSGQTVTDVVRQLREEMKQLKSESEHQKHLEQTKLYQKRLDEISAVLQRAEPGDLIIQGEGRPAYILSKKPLEGRYVKAFPLDPRCGTFLKVDYYSIGTPPRIASMPPLARKLLLGYVEVREKLSDHVIVAVGAQDGRVACRVGTKEFGFYWLRDFRGFFPFGA